MRPTSILALAAVLASGAVHAQQTMVIPANVSPTIEGSSSTSYPWNRDGSTTTSNDIRVLYSYDSTNITAPGPILINQLRFRADDTTTSWGGCTYGNVEVRIGDAAADYSTLSSGQTWDSAYASGVAPAPVYAGPVQLVAGSGNGTGVPGPWYVTVPLSNPVLYDPTTGTDLIIDIAHDGTVTPSGSAYLSDAQSTGANGRRMYNLTDWQATTSSGSTSTTLVCELGYTPAQGTYASFSVDKSEVGPGETVQFTDTSFTSDPGGLVGWVWDLDGDGTADSMAQNPSWQYTACGPKNVTLTVFDAGGGQDTVTVNAAVDVKAPVADFGYQVINSTSPYVVNFTDQSSFNPTSWAWDLDGDGSVDSNAQNPQWGYPQRGVVNVTLTATNSCGSDTVTIPIDTRLKLCTQFGGIAGWDTGGAFYMDVDILNPAGLTIEALGVQIQDPGIQALINVYIKPGRHAGYEDDRNAWALVSTGTNPNSAGTPNETVIDVTDFSMAPGQWAIAIEYLQSQGRFNYTTSSGTNASNSDLALSGGAMHDPAFVGNTTFAPRNWNGCVYYAIGQQGGSFSVIADGCAGTAGTIPTIGIQGGGVPRINSTLTLETTGAAVSEPSAIISVGFTNLGGLNLGVIGMPGCAAWVSGDFSLPTPTDAAGVGSGSFPIPNMPILIGGQFYCQPIMLDLGANSRGAIVGDAAQGSIGG